MARTLNLTPVITSIRISETSKLDGIKSWSLQAIDTCPGSVKKGGGLVDACLGCYATTGNYNFPNVIAPRLINQEDWKRMAWVDDMVAALIVTHKATSRFFRWFDSGDMYTIELALKIYDVMVRTPDVQHWLPTRMGKFAKFKQIIAKMMLLPNVMVRFSADSIDGTYTKGLHGSVITPDATQIPAGTTLCRAYEHDGKCSGCRACYSKDVAVIAYPAHGTKMKKVIRIAQAA